MKSKIPWPPAFIPVIKFDHATGLCGGMLVVSSRNDPCSMSWATPDERRNLGQSRRKQLGRQQNDQLNIRPGPNTDMIGNDGRNPNDGCHMNELGTLASATLWAAFIN